MRVAGVAGWGQVESWFQYEKFRDLYVVCAWVWHVGQGWQVEGQNNFAQEKCVQAGRIFSVRMNSPPQPASPATFTI